MISSIYSILNEYKQAQKNNYLYATYRKTSLRNSISLYVLT